MYLRTDDECVWAADRTCGMTGGKTISHAGRRHWQINYLPNQFTIYA